MARKNVQMQPIDEENSKTNEPATPAGDNPFAAMSWTALRRYASDRDVVSWRRTRAEIENDLLQQLRGEI